MESYDKVAKVVGPKKEALGKAEGELAEAMGKLEAKRASLRTVQERLQELQNKLEANKQRKVDLENEVRGRSTGQGNPSRVVCDGVSFFGVINIRLVSLFEPHILR